MHGLDHLAVGKEAGAPGLAARELHEVDAALVDNLVDLIRVVIGEDADRERPLARQQTLEGGGAVLEPGAQSLP